MWRLGVKAEKPPQRIAKCFARLTIVLRVTARELLQAITYPLHGLLDVGPSLYLRHRREMWDTKLKALSNGPKV